MKCKIIESPEQEARQEQCRKEVDRIIRETPRQISMEMYARAVAFEAYATGWNLRAELAQKEVEAAIAAERSRLVAAIEAWQEPPGGGIESGNRDSDGRR